MRRDYGLKLIIVISLSLVGPILLQTVCLGAIYYVDTTGGDDSNDGLSAQTAWKTAAKVNSMSFVPGDEILFKRGEIWRGELIVPSSGEDRNPITFRAYGKGDKPIITGRGVIYDWDNAGSWTLYSGNIWYFSLGHFPYRLWLSGQEYKKAESLEEIDTQSRWYYDNDNYILYVYAISNPATYYSAIEEVCSRKAVIRIREKDYITIRELDLRGGYYTINIAGSDHIIVEDNNIGLDSGVFGVLVLSQKNNLSQYGIIRNNTIDSGYKLYCDYYPITWAFEGVSLRDGTQYWQVHDNIIKNWHHGGFNVKNLKQPDYPTIYNKFYRNYITAPDISYGRAFATVGKEIGACQYNEFYRNYIYKTTVRSQIGGDHNLIYYNIIDTMTNSGAKTYGTAGGISLEQMFKGDGICYYNKIYNNVIYNTDEPGIRVDSYGLDDKVKGNEIINNIMIDCGKNSKYASRMNIGMSVNKHISENIFKNNLIYTSGVDEAVYYKGTRMSIHEFNNTPPLDGDTIADNIQQDPLLVDIQNRDFKLQSDSPCIDVGIDVGLTQDFDGNLIPQGSAPDIGAYEYVSSILLYRDASDVCLQQKMRQNKL